MNPINLEYFDKLPTEKQLMHIYYELKYVSGEIPSLRTDITKLNSHMATCTVNNENRISKLESKASLSQKIHLLIVASVIATISAFILKGLT